MSGFKIESLSFCLVEHDCNGDHMCVWVYPDVSASLQTLCNRRAAEATSEKLFYFKLKNDWIYILKSKSLSDKFPALSFASLCVVARSFSPSKYYVMLRNLLNPYAASGDPTKILEGILSIHATGEFNGFSMSDYNSKLDLKNNIKSLVDTLEVDFAILWNAVVLKKRILVLLDSVDSIEGSVCALSLLANHRNDFAMLRPLVLNEPEYLEDLSTCGYYIAGTLDKSVAEKVELFDVLLDLTEKKLVISAHAMDAMRMCSIHRDVAKIASEVTTDEVIKVIGVKTQQLVSNLKLLAEDGQTKITENDVVTKVSNPATQQWLLKFAMAEDML